MKRFEIQKKLKQQQKLKAKEVPDDATGAASAGDIVDDVDFEIGYNNVVNTKDRSETRRKNMEEKKFDQKSSALSELKAKRQEKERKDAERQKKETEKEEERKSRESKRQRSSSSSSSSSGGSDRDRR